MLVLYTKKHKKLYLVEVNGVSLSKFLVGFLLDPYSKDEEYVDCGYL